MIAASEISKDASVYVDLCCRLLRDAEISYKKMTPPPAARPAICAMLARRFILNLIVAASAAAVIIIESEYARDA